MRRTYCSTENLYTYGGGIYVLTAFFTSETRLRASSTVEASLVTVDWVMYCMDAVLRTVVLYLS